MEPPPEVVKRRQAINEEAFYNVLRVIMNTGSDPKAVAIAGKLKVHLNISQEQYKKWRNELVAAKRNGTLLLDAHGQAGGWGGSGKAGAGARAGSDALMGVYDMHAGAAGAGGSAGKGGARKKQRQMQQAMEGPSAAEENDLFGCRVQRWWPDIGTWKEGVISGYNPGTNNICITYNIQNPEEAISHWYVLEHSPEMVIHQERLGDWQPGMIQYQ